MSYDLFFNRQQGFSASEFQRFFANRTKYQMNKGQAWYQNEDTGVYFSFEMDDEPESETLGNPSFNMNYYRPHFFALEAAPEVEAFIKNFGFSVDDSQIGGMGVGEFTVEGFLKGWSQGNEFGYKAVLQGDSAPDRVYSRPTFELENIWRWNYEKETIQKKLGDDIFVPKIVWILLEGELFSAVVWPDGIPTLIPEVDRLIVPRDELAPRKFFNRQNDMCIIPGSEVNEILPPYDHKSYPLPARVPDYDSAPDRVRMFVQSLVKNEQKMVGVAPDSVLNFQMVEGAKKPDDK